MSFVAPDGTVLDKMPVNEFVTDKGEFKKPRRLANESYWKWQKRVSDAMLKSGLYPKQTYASKHSERTKLKNEKGLRNQLNRAELSLQKMDAAIGTENEYSANIGRKSLLKNINTLKRKLKPFNDQKEDTNLKNLVKKNQSKGNNEQSTEQLVDKVIDSNGGDSKVVRHYNNQRPSIGTSNLFDDISAELGIVNREPDEQTKRKLGLEVGSVNRETSSLSINPSDATPGNKAKEKLTMPKTWARGQGRKLKDVNKDTEAYLRQEGWGEALDSSRDKDELLRAARTDQLLISKGFVHTDDGVFKIDKKEEVLTA